MTKIIRLDRWIEILSNAYTNFKTATFTDKDCLELCKYLEELKKVKA